MKKLSYFLMVGLAFTVLQVSTVAAQTGDPNIAPPTGTSGMPPMGDSCMTVPAGPDRDACYSSMSGSSMPPGGHHDGPPGSHDGPPGMRGQHDGPPGGHHDGPPGGHHDGPPNDPRSGQPFTKADEDKYQKYGDECEATKGLLSEGSMQELVADGFTRLQVEKLCKDGPADHRDGPPQGQQHDQPGDKTGEFGTPPDNGAPRTDGL